ALHAEIAASASQAAIEAATWKREHRTENTGAETALPPRGTYDYVARWFAACALAACLLTLVISAFISFGDRDSSSASSEQEAFLRARGNLDRLQEYLRDCTACTYAAQTRVAIAELQARAREEKDIYEAARGDLERLTLYVQSCSVCVFKTQAEA